MPITNNSSNDSSPRGRGRPALGNIDRLYARFCDAYRDGVGLSLSVIASEFGWTEGTARAMVSQVRTTHHVTIYYRRRAGKFYLQSLPANAPTLRTDASPPVPTVPAPAPAPHVPSLAEVIRERLDGPARTPVAAPAPVADTLDSLAAEFNAIDGYYSREYWRDLISGWCRGTTRVESLVVGAAFARVRERTRAFVTAERARNGIRPPAPAPLPDSLWRGIDPVVASFYRERALDLRQ